MQIQKASPLFWPQILQIYDKARAFMAQSGNPHQWVGGYPSRQVLQQDLQKGHLYICTNGAQVAAVFCFRPGPDPTYAHIEKGHWLNDLPYYVVHRLAVAEHGKGAGSFCLRWCLQQSPSLRVDTHKDNIPMQKLILKSGFVYCGIIYTDNGSARLAYQHTLPTN